MRHELSLFVSSQVLAMLKAKVDMPPAHVRMKHVLKLFLTSPDLVAAYGDFATLAERALVLPPTSVEPERGASALKRQKRKDRYSLLSASSVPLVIAL